MRECSACYLQKPDSDFYPKRRQCRKCHTNRVNSRGNINWRENHLKQRYNITIDDYEKLLAKQHGRCWICGAEPKTRRLHVDHNHKTGQVRGLLCFKCNKGIGFFADSWERLENAAKYLKKEKDV